MGEAARTWGWVRVVVLPMARVSVPARKALIYQGRSYVRGELIECDAAEALMLSRRGDVTLTRGVTFDTRAVTADAEPEPAIPVMRRRRYLRRDLTAEGSQE